MYFKFIAMITGGSVQQPWRLFGVKQSLLILLHAGWVGYCSVTGGLFGLQISLVHFMDINHEMHRNSAQKLESCVCDFLIVSESSWGLSLFPYVHKAATLTIALFTGLQDLDSDLPDDEWTNKISLLHSAAAFASAYNLNVMVWLSFWGANSLEFVSLTVFLFISNIVENKLSCHSKLCSDRLVKIWMGTKWISSEFELRWKIVNKLPLKLPLTRTTVIKLLCHQKQCAYTLRPSEAYNMRQLTGS